MMTVMDLNLGVGEEIIIILLLVILFEIGWCCKKILSQFPKPQGYPVRPSY